MRSRYFVALVGGVPVAAGLSHLAAARKAAQRMGEIYSAFGPPVDAEEEFDIPIHTGPCTREVYQRVLASSLEDLAFDMAARELELEAEEAAAADPGAAPASFLGAPAGSVLH